MIYGVGTDVVEIGRIKAVLEKYGERFARKILCEPELRRFANHRLKAHYLAKRFAAKEACSKALGTGIRRGVWWRDMGVVNLAGGRPTMKLTGGALARLESLTPPGHEARIDLTITDDWPLAQAFVIISAVPSSKA